MDLNYVVGPDLVRQATETGTMTIVPLGASGYGPGVQLPNGDNWLLWNYTNAWVLSGGVPTQVSFSFSTPEPIAYDSANDRVIIGHGGGVEFFNASSRAHVMTRSQAPGRYATCIAVSPDGGTLYLTYGADDIVALDVASNTTSTFHTQPSLNDPAYGTPEFFEFFTLTVHPSGEIWAFSGTSFGRTRVWFFRFSANGTVLQQTPLVESGVGVSHADFHTAFNAAWDFAAGVGYWSYYGDDKVASYSPYTGGFVNDVFPDSAAQYDAAGGSAYPDRPSWQLSWGSTPHGCPPRLVARASVTAERVRVH